MKLLVVGVDGPIQLEQTDSLKFVYCKVRFNLEVIVKKPSRPISR